MKNTYSLKNIFLLPKIEPFELVISKGCIKVDPQKGDAPMHIHSHFEIFLNISGNIDFIVGNRIYSLSYGDVLVIKPNEYHHSIYRHACMHEYFFIFFPVTNNEELFYSLLNLDDKSGSAINLSTDERTRFIKLCNDLVDDSDDNENPQKYLKFFSLIEIISNANAQKNIDEKKASEPQFEMINDILKYIGENADVISATEDVASQFHISLKTLERMFKKHIGQTPKNYIDMLRLSKASEYLRKGNSVTEACYLCGFKDCSRFIKYFKKQFGETPFQYKKRFLNSIINAYYLNEHKK